MDKPLLYSTSAGKYLSEAFLTDSGFDQGLYRLGRFADNEIMFYLDAPVDDKVCFVLGSTGSPGENLLEMFTIINTLKINHAKTIIPIIPYLGYSRSDRDKPLQPVNAKLFAGYLEQAGADKIICLNLHSNLLEQYFTIPLIHLSAMSLFARHIENLVIPNLEVATPDKGGTDRAIEFAHNLNLKDIVIVEKHRPTDDSTEVTHVVGDIKGKNIILVDDMIQTGHTLQNAALALKEKGAGRIFAAATHCVYQAKGINLLTSTSLFEKIYITNSLTNHILPPSNVTIVDIVPLLSEAASKAIN